MRTSIFQRRLHCLALALAFTMIGCSKKAPPTLTESLIDMRMANVKARLRSGADPNEQDPQGRSMLHAAVFHGNHEVVRYLLEHKADVNIRTATGITPLAVAVGRDDLDLVRYLLEHKADVNIATATGITPLAVAVWKDNLEIAEFLVRQGADVNARSPKDNRAVLDVAKSTEMTTFLVSHGAKHGSELR